MRFLDVKCVNECRQICEKAGVERNKICEQIEKLKEKRAKAKEQKKKGSGNTKDKKTKSATEKSNNNTNLKKLKEQEDELKRKIEVIGETVLVDLVDCISKRGNLNTIVKAMEGSVGSEARKVWCRQAS
eukprot:Skav225917  [mRNA]  locus=scaffold1500:184271:184827:- [translate_table: standard]